MRLFATSSWKKFFAVEVLILVGGLTFWLLLRIWPWVPNHLTNRQIDVVREDLSTCVGEIRQHRSELDSLKAVRITLPNGFSEKRIRAVFDPPYYLGSEPPFESYPWLYQGNMPAIVLSPQDVHVQFVEYERNGWVVPSDAELPSYIATHIPYLYPGWNAADIVRDVKKGMQEVHSAHNAIVAWDDRVAASRQLAESELSRLEVKRRDLTAKTLSLKKELIPSTKAEREANTTMLYVLICVYPIRIILALFMWALRTVRSEA